MDEERDKKALEALNKINEVLDGVRDLFPTILRGQAKIKIVNPKYTDPLKILKRVNGIIKNFDESNAERKLKNLLKFLNITLRKKS